MTSAKLSRILVIAGSDSGGGAGIQADIKTVTCLGGYAMTAVTALTAQNTQGVFSVYPVSPAFVVEQMRCVLEDIGADAVKTGMLHSAAIIETVAEMLQTHAPSAPLVVDPVMVAKGGAPLLQAEATHALRSVLAPRAALLTPNIPEAEALSGITIERTEDMQKAAEKILSLGAKAVLLKGGHADGKTVTDLLVTPAATRRFESPRINTRHTHGTGCTLASAIATGLAQGLALEPSVERARAYVLEAIRTAPQLGHGHGPLNHRINA